MLKKKQSELWNGKKMGIIRKTNKKPKVGMRNNEKTKYITDWMQV